MKRTIFISIIVVLFSIPAYNQVQLTQYFMDGTHYNPAFAGSHDAICASVSGRQQWVGLNDEKGQLISPQSFIFNLHTPVFMLNSGVGMNFFYDKAGYETSEKLKINYDYRFRFRDENKSLAIGIAPSFMNKTVDFSQLTTELPNDPLMSGSQKKTGSIFDMDFGVLYQDLNRIYIGLSVTDLLQSSAMIGNAEYELNRNFYLTGGYYINLTGQRRKSLYVIPSFLIKSDFNNMQFDINARVEYAGAYWAGLSYRYQDAIAVLAGMKVKNLRIGVSYDLTTGYLSPVSKGSPEIFIGYCYTIRPKVVIKSRYNTRYL